MFRSLYLLVALFLGIGIIVGCSTSTDSGTKTKETPDSNAKQKSVDPAHGNQSDAEHAHKPSAHGGIVVPIGSDSYHAEAVFEKGGLVHLYTLGKDEAKVLEVEAQPLNAFVKIEGGTDSQSIVFRPEPQKDDEKGKTSLFVTHLPREFWGQKLEVTIPSIRIGGERFRLGFKSVPDKHDDSHTMPTKRDDQEERKTFLTPGGKYTEADIKANGNRTGSQKFKGLKPEHDLKPKTGELLCPISMTKANPKFTWIVGGKSYQFCCPPCVEEFVAIAKEHPEQIKDPEEYRKK